MNKDKIIENVWTSQSNAVCERLPLMKEIPEVCFCYPRSSVLLQHDNLSSSLGKGVIYGI
jgi:hypothetical protein